MQIEKQQPKLCQQEEEQAYQFQNLPVSITIDNSNVSFLSNVLQILPDGFTFLQQKGKDEWFSIYGAFTNTNSVGISGNSLMIFIGDQLNEDNQEETPQVIKIIRNSKAGQNVCLTGYCFNVQIDFGKEGKNVLKEVHDIFVNYMGDADEQRQSRFDQDEEMGQMISADDIDENGNIIKNNQSQQDECEEKQQEQLNHQTQN